MIETINSYEEFSQLINDTELTVIDFTATWCGPCKAIAPKFDEMHKMFPKANFAKIDIDNPNTESVCNQLVISSVPTFILFKNNVKLFEFRGANADMLLKSIQ